MRVLGQHATGEQGLADRTAGGQLRVDVDAGPETGAAHGHHALADQPGQPGMQVGAQHPGALLLLAGGQQFHHGKADGRRQGVAPEGRAVLAGAEHAEDVPVADDRGDRHDAAAEGLAEQVEVRNDTHQVAGEGRSRAAEAGLDLVGDEQHIVSRRDLAHGRQIVRRRHDDAGLALDRLEQHGNRVRVDRSLEGRRVPVGNSAEPRRERPEILAGRFVVGEADDRGGAAVEVLPGHDDVGHPGGDTLDPVAPGASHLDAGLDRFGTRVHREDHVLAGEFGERGHERAELVVVKGAAGERDAAQLLASGVQQEQVRVAEVDRGVRGQAVQVAAAVDIRHPRAVARRDDHGQRMVVVGRVLVFQGDERTLVEGGGRRSDLLGHRRSSSVQHFTPPPPSSSSDKSTPMGLKPRARSWRSKSLARAAMTTL